MTKITADSINHPVIKEQNGEQKFVLPFVREGQLIEHECTKEIFSKIESQRLAYNFRKTFTLAVNPESGLIDRIDSQPKQNFFTERMNLEEDNTENTQGVPFVILSKFSDGSVDVKAKPNNVKQEIVDEIVDYVYEQKDEIKAHDFIADKYLVTDVRQNGQYIYVDPTVR